MLRDCTGFGVELIYAFVTNTELLTKDILREEDIPVDCVAIEASPRVLTITMHLTQASITDTPPPAMQKAQRTIRRAQQVPGASRLPSPFRFEAR